MVFMVRVEYYYVFRFFPAEGNGPHPSSSSDSESESEPGESSSSSKDFYLLHGEEGEEQVVAVAGGSGKWE